MNRLNIDSRSKTTTLRTSLWKPPFRCGLFSICTLACFALSPPNAFGVLPAPDGGYPGLNTAEGQNALLSLTTGSANTAVGWFSLKSDTSGGFNTALGAGTLAANTGNQNTATGAAALYSNTTGVSNTANGALALFSNTTGYDNTANGVGALFTNSDGYFNTANGVDALFRNTGGAANTATGDDALFANTTGSANTAIGSTALAENTAGGSNTAVGIFALYLNTSGSRNIALGSNAGHNITGNNNIAIGNDGFANVDNSIVIGSDIHTDCHIAGIYNSVLLSGEPVAITSDGKLGYLPSSARFKRDIEPMGTSSKALLALKPVTFHYKGDKTNAPQFGLVAEEVAKVNPDLVVRTNKGELHTVRYDAVNAMLLNEFLKEHRKVEALEATVAQQRKGLDIVTAQLREQAAQIQKVSAQVQVSKFATGRIRRGGPAPRMVLNP